MELMTRKEAAEKLRIGLRTLDRRLASGEIQCFRLGNGPRAPVRISAAQLDSYLQEAHARNGKGIREQASLVLGR